MAQVTEDRLFKVIIASEYLTMAKTRDEAENKCLQALRDNISSGERLNVDIKTCEVDSSD